MICLLAHARRTYCDEALEPGDHGAVWPKAVPEGADVCEDCTRERAAALQIARPLVGVYFQVSAHYRHVARLPEGKTGIEALQDAVRASLESGGVAPREFIAEQMEWAAAMGERNAADHYMRCHAPESRKLTLHRNVWAAYKELGGSTVQR